MLPEINNANIWFHIPFHIFLYAHIGVIYICVYF